MHYWSDNWSFVDVIYLKLYRILFEFLHHFTFSETIKRPSSTDRSWWWRRASPRKRRDGPHCRRPVQLWPHYCYLKINTIKVEEPNGQNGFFMQFTHRFRPRPSYAFECIWCNQHTYSFCLIVNTPHSHFEPSAPGKSAETFAFRRYYILNRQNDLKRIKY